MGISFINVNFLYGRNACALFSERFLSLLVLSGLLFRIILMPNMHIWVGESWFLSFETQWFSLKSKMGKSQESPERLGLGSLRPGPTWIGSTRAWIPVSTPAGCEGGPLGCVLGRGADPPLFS